MKPEPLLAELNRLRRRIQIVFQDPYGSFNPRHRVERLVAEPFHLLGDKPAPPERRRRVEDVLARRSRWLLLDARRSAEAAEEVASALASELGRGEAWAAREAAAFRELAAGYAW